MKELLISYSPILLMLVICIGSHFFMHGKGGHGSHGCHDENNKKESDNN